MALTYSKKQILKINRETENAVSITLDTQNDSSFNYTSGQYITIKHLINDETLVRSYSISSCPSLEKEVTFTVKAITDGRMSNFLNEKVKVGDYLEVLPPVGNFTIKKDNVNEFKTYVFIAAGSGITPIMSMIKTLLSENTSAKVILIYGNKTLQDVIFYNELNDLKERYTQFSVYHIFSQELSANAYLKGRVAIDNLLMVCNENQVIIRQETGFYLCGPDEMMQNIMEHLQNREVLSSNIRFESFTNADATSSKENKIASETPLNNEISSITVIIGGKEHNVPINPGETVLDAAMDLNAPFSCMSASCMVCKAKIISGEIEMDDDGPLDEKEIEEGYILTCQSKPKSGNIVITYDI